MSTELAPLTRKEVEAWPPLGPMALKAQRVLAVFDELARVNAELITVRGSFDPLNFEFQRTREELAQVRAELEQTRRELEIARRDLAADREAMRKATSEIEEITANVAALVLERDELKGQVAFLADALWRDDVGMSKALGQIRKHIRDRAWVLEGRGPLEWNDDTYREEAGLAMRPCLEIAERALSSSGDLLHPTLRDVKARAKAWVDGLRFEAAAAFAGAIVKAFEVKDSDMVIIQGLTLEGEAAEHALKTIAQLIEKTGRKPIVVGLSPLEPISVDIMRPAQREHLRDELNRHMGAQRLSSSERVELRSYVSDLLEPTSSSGDNRLGELIERLMASPEPVPTRRELDAARVEVNTWWLRLVRGELDLVRYAAMRHPDAADPFTREAFEALRAHDARVAELSKPERCKATSNLGACVLEVGHAGQHAAHAPFGIDIGAPSSAPKKVLPECSSTEHAHCSLCGACERRPGEQCLCYAR